MCIRDRFSKSEFIEKKKILEEDYGLKMSMELEGRMSEMCNVSDYWEEVATEAVSYTHLLAVGRGFIP